MMKKLACTFTDGYSTYDMTFKSFFTSRCLYKFYTYMKNYHLACLSAKFI